MRINRKAASIFTGFGKYIIVAFILIVVLFPFYWMVITSLRSDAETFMKVNMWPRQFTLKNYKSLVGGPYKFIVALKNSLIVSTSVTIVAVLISIFAAYALVRFKLRGSPTFLRVILVAYLFPPTILFIPLAVLITKWGLSNTLASLMLTYPTFAVPFCVWMLVGYFQNIPAELEEAALIDGCSRSKALFLVIIPVSAPGVVASAIFTFTLCWTEYLYALVMTTSLNKRTLPVSFTDLIYSDMYAWGQLMSSAVIMCIPVVILYLLAQKYVAGGMLAGGVKG